MGKVPFKVLFGILFVLVAFLLMFFDAQVHIDFQSKPSMIFLHRAHLAGEYAEEGGEHIHGVDDNHGSTAPMEGMDH